VTHHIEEILPEIGRVIMMKDGRVARDGAKGDMLTDAALTDLFGLPMTVSSRDGWFGLQLS